jgi:two-component system NtrC family sensor kinase
VDATPECGEITITTSRIDDALVRVNISDNGSGIPKDRIKQIFEPFFTTKERGKGTGLGLFVTHAILKKLKCDISVQSEVGKGTTFIIDIPVNPPRAEEAAA